MYKRIINKSSKTTFKCRLCETSCKGSDNPNKSYVKFIETVTQIYDDCFAETKFKIKSNNKPNPWITKGIAKSSKRKQKLYEDYRKRFEAIAMKPKRKTTLKNYYNFKVTPKNHRIMKKVIGKSKLIHSTLPRKIGINKNVIFEEKRTANAFNNFFINIGPT